MGNCTFTIKTVGCHGNMDAEGAHRADDAEVLLAELVDHLKRGGHSVLQAELTHGAEFQLDVGRHPLFNERAKVKSVDPKPTAK